jgi:hypothetical protein
VIDDYTPYFHYGVTITADQLTEVLGGEVAEKVSREEFSKRLGFGWEVQPGIFVYVASEGGDPAQQSEYMLWIGQGFLVNRCHLTMDEIVGSREVYERFLALLKKYNVGSTPSLSMTLKHTPGECFPAEWDDEEKGEEKGDVAASLPPPSIVVPK